ncbi:serine/threonine-protein kinase [Thermocatellispora tengchongensis]|uniref:serine/threonine-protein kinase n=1 Tax=Thermocatellispora tengchongensis TaxID=1073253 RepID=UPI0028A81EA5|nr:extracellular solute-binding protein [Thermocatellispora tengchongensis]
MGGYEVLARLGEGGMGTVYLARAGQAAPGAGRLVAIKVIRRAVAEDPGFRARFEREVANARRVASFCTAEVLDHGLSDGRPFMVTEYIEGVPLSDQVERHGPLSAGTLYGVAVGVAAALTAIHAAGLVHRDLKPANVMLSLSGPRVIDFGIARAADALARHTSPGQLVGSPGYIAPEQLGGGEITAAADIFAWACLVVYAGTGRHPFGAGTVAELAARVLYAEPSVGPLDPPLDALVRRALSRDPAARPSAEEILVALAGGRGAQAGPGDPDRAASAVLTASWHLPPDAALPSVPPIPSVPSVPSVPPAPTRPEAPGTLPPVPAHTGHSAPIGHAAHSTHSTHTIPEKPLRRGGRARKVLVPLTAALAAAAVAAATVFFVRSGDGTPTSPPTAAPGTSAPGTSAPPAAGDGPKTLTVWMMGDRTSTKELFLEGVEREFRKQYPETDVKVTYVPWAQALQRFRAARAGGDAPDVTEIGNTHVGGLIDAGALADITAEMAAWREGGGLDQKAVAADRRDGRTYAMPWYTGVHGIWYRKDWFAELGLEPPRSWAGLVAAAKAIQKAKGVPGIGAPTRQTYAIMSWIWGAGGDVAVRRDGRWRGVIDSPQAAAGVRFFTGLVTDERVAPEAYIGRYPLNGPLQDFVRGRLGMYVDGSWMLSDLEKRAPKERGNFAIFPIPAREGGAAPVFGGGSELAVWGKSRAKKAAFAYLTHLNSRANSMKFADTFSYTSRYAGVVPAGEALRSLAQVTGDIRTAPETPGWTAVESTVIPGAMAAIMRGASADAELARAAREITRLLNEGDSGG